MPTDPIPGPHRPAAGVECPHCGTQLRLLRPAAPFIPISCYQCGSTFYIEPIETAPVAEPPPGRPGGGYPGRPPLRVVSPPGRPPRRPGPDDPPPAMTSPPPPPPLSTRTRPGMPVPSVAPDEQKQNFRTRWLESLLGTTLVVLLLVAAGAGGLVLWKVAQGGPADTPREMAERPPDTPADVQPAAAADKPEKPAATVPVVAEAPKPLPLPPELYGVWESRSDDGSHAAFVFRPDGTVTIVTAHAEDIPAQVVTVFWFLARHAGDEYVLEVGEGQGATGNFRISLRLGPSDGLTVNQIVRYSVPQDDGPLRYVRVAEFRVRAAPAKPPP